MNLTDRTDAGLVTGPPEEFGELFERYARTLYDYCARRVGRQQAEDLVAETFLVAFARRDRYDPAAPSARPWLFGILTNLLRSHHRSETRGWRALARAGSDPGAPPDPFPDRAGERLDARAALRSIAGVLAGLPAAQRDLLLLHVWAGMDYAELATALDLPAGTVRSRLHRAKARLRAAVPDHYAP